MEILGFLLAALVGISLGLIGSGGSILMVPILVYVMGLEPVLATSYSLFIVGTTALVGAFNNYRKGWVHVKIAFLFGLTSILTVYISRKWLIPLIPDQLFSAGSMVITKAMATMVLFAILMLMAATAMIRSKPLHQVVISADASPDYLKLFSYGLLVGLVTGFLGAGGGFLIIPVLVLVFALPMKEAVGTSLLIIALNSLIGFTGDLGHFELNWKLLLAITSIAVAGIFIGGWLAKRVDGNKLKVAFGWFVLLMGTYIITKELFLK
ncbi:MAG: hypothetical protein RI924_853 [Bacteroidota bacterium]|jgi:uncharacterized membrane protein YfcA